MMQEPRHRDEYSERQVTAAKRVLVDLGQVLGSYKDSMVVVGGWVPDLLLPAAEEQHIGSIDVDIALDAKRLNDGRYARLVQTLSDTRRYVQAEEPFRLYTMVDLADGEIPIRVDVDFLKAPEAKTKRNVPPLTDGFRPLEADGCSLALKNPERVMVAGRMITGAENSVEVRVASIADFLVMKAHALAKRDKPKDAYDICYCIEHYPGGMEELAKRWRAQSKNKHVARAIQMLRDKFDTVNSYGSQQVVVFHNAADPDTQAMHARRAFETVQKFIQMV